MEKCIYPVEIGTTWDSTKTPQCSQQRTHPTWRNVWEYSCFKLVVSASWQPCVPCVDLEHWLCTTWEINTMWNAIQHTIWPLGVFAFLSHAIRITVCRAVWLAVAPEPVFDNQWAIYIKAALSNSLFLSSGYFLQPKHFQCQVNTFLV